MDAVKPPDVRGALRFVGGTATVDESGLRLRPWYTRSAVLVPWSNVEFACPTPFLTKDGGGWKTYRGVPLTGRSLSDGLRIYCIGFVLRKRQDVWRSFGVAGKLWLLIALGYRAMMNADDKFDRTQGLIELDLHRRRLLRTLPVLVRFLEDLRVHTPFGSYG